MAYPKRLGAANNKNKERAIAVHAGIINFVEGKVKKIGIEKVHSIPEYKWLRKLHERVLDFAEQVQIKEIPTTLEGAGEEGAFLVEVRISNDNNATQEPGNGISEYIKV